MSDVEVGTKRSGDYDEYGEISSYKKSRTDNMKMRFLLVGRYCGAIIGKGGENIKRLRKEYSVQVNMPDTRSNDRVLTITGDRDNCVSVLKEILPLCAEAPYPVNPKEKCAFELNFLVQSDQVGCVIGKGGAKIKEIREESNGKIKVYQDCLPNSNERIVAIGGDDETRVFAAFDIVLNTLREHPRKSQTIYYDPKNKHNDGQSGGGHQMGHQMGNQMGMGGGNQMGMGGGNLGLGGGLGGLRALGGLGLAGAAAGLLGQLGVGAQGGAGILGAAGGLQNMWGNDNRNDQDGILGTGGAVNRGGQPGGFGGQKPGGFGDQSGGFGMNRNHSPPRGGRGEDYRQSQSSGAGDYRQTQSGGILHEYYGQKLNASIANAFGNAGGSTRDIPEDRFRNKGLGEERDLSYDDHRRGDGFGISGGYGGGNSLGGENQPRQNPAGHGNEDVRLRFQSHSNSRSNEDNIGDIRAGFQNNSIGGCHQGSRGLADAALSIAGRWGDSDVGVGALVGVSDDGTHRTGFKRRGDTDSGGVGGVAASIANIFGSCEGVTDGGTGDCRVRGDVGILGRGGGRTSDVGCISDCLREEDMPVREIYRNNQRIRDGNNPRREFTDVRSTYTTDSRALDLTSRVQDTGAPSIAMLWGEYGEDLWGNKCSGSAVARACSKTDHSDNEGARGNVAENIGTIPEGTCPKSFSVGGQFNGPNANRGNRDQRNDFDSEDRDRLDFSQMQTVTKITVLNDMCGAIIGKSGQRIRDIRQNTGARVDFSETEKGSKADRVITITGTQQQIVLAQQMMAQCVRNRNN